MCQLVEVPAGDRAPILKRYLAKVPGARPHIPVDPSAPLSAFRAISRHYPVFQVVPLTGRAAGRAQGSRPHPRLPPTPSGRKARPTTRKEPGNVYPEGADDLPPAEDLA
jgi:hypothetical protein